MQSGCVVLKKSNRKITSVTAVYQWLSMHWTQKSNSNVYEHSNIKSIFFRYKYVHVTSTYLYSFYMICRFKKYVTCNFRVKNSKFVIQLHVKKENKNLLK